MHRRFLHALIAVSLLLTLAGPVSADSGIGIGDEASAVVTHAPCWPDCPSEDPAPEATPTPTPAATPEASTSDTVTITDEAVAVVTHADIPVVAAPVVIHRLTWRQLYARWIAYMRAHRR